MTLAEYLGEAARRPWQPGVHDCTAWPARWAGIELPAYGTDAEGAALIAEAGSLEALWGHHIGGRLERVDEPEPGDAGIILALGRQGTTEVGALFTGRRWGFVTPRGLACVSTTAVAIWRVPCPKP